MSAVNDFCFKIGTVNGTGSASANGLLMQAIFRMGIPVVGKNVFPSNIQGLPTWYEIRVNKNGYTARTAPFDLMVAMNTGTYARDINEITPGGWLLYDSSWPLPKGILRDDVNLIGIPLGEMCNNTFTGDRERTLMKNIAYTGALAALIDIDMDVVHAMLQEKFGRKKHLLESNYKAIRLGYDYAREHYPCPLPFHLEKMDATGDYILMDGNAAAALGCVYAGATVGAWYPITPATSLMENFRMFCEKFRKTPEGKRNFCIVQAEDELAAAGMVIGAGWMGARAFTPTAGPGISLMGEFVGLAYYAEVPAVFFDVQRTGPSTGMPTRTQQSDLLSTAYLSHGDTKHVLLFPANPEECFTMARDAFDLAERFQTPVFVMMDLDIGMNDWMCKRFVWDDSYRPDRGKVLDSAALAKVEKFYRYLSTNGDGVAARTLPGVDPKGSYFTRGSGHTKYGTYTEDPDEYREVMDRLVRKLAAAGDATPTPEIIVHHDVAAIGVITVGGCRGAVLEGLDRLHDQGVALDYMRIRGFPFNKAVRDFVAVHERCIVIEQNRDGQLRSMLILETGTAPERLLSLREYGGLPLETNRVVEGVLGLLEGVPA